MTSNFKNLSIRFAPALIVLISIFVIGCNKPEVTPEPTPIVLRTDLLTSGAWRIASVKVDGVDRSDFFVGMTIRFLGTSTGIRSTEITNGAPIWPANGPWFFKDAEAQFIRVADLDLTVLTLTENSFVAQLQWSKNTLGEGKVASISGQYVFSFVR